MRKKLLVGGVTVFFLVVGLSSAASVRLSAPDLVTVTQEPTVDSLYSRFKVLAKDVRVPAGERVRFEMRTGGFSRASLLAAGKGASPEGTVALVTLFGPPLVPAGSATPLKIGVAGGFHGAVVQPVLGPVMVVVVYNDSSAPVSLTLSAYLTR